MSAPCSGRERLAVGLLALTLVLATSAPWAYGWLAAPGDRRFLAVHSINAADTWVYFALMEQARAGHLVLRNLHTPEPHPAFGVRPVYLLGGWLAAATRLPTDVAYHALRALACALLVVALHALSRRALDRPRDRLAFVAVACAASGLGWLSAGQPLDPASTSVDLWVPEAVTFLAAYESPHFTVSLALLCAVVALAIDAAGPAPRRWGPPALGAATLLLALEHPYDLPPLAALLALWPVLLRRLGRPVQRPLLLALGGAFAGMALGAVYHGACLAAVPVVAAWERQNLLPSPSPLALAQGYGLLLPLAALGARDLRGRRPELAALLVAWALLPLVLAYAPVRFQRRMIEGAQLPLALLATIGLLSLLDRPTLARPARAALLVAAVALLPLTNAVVVARDLLLFRERRSPFHVSRDLTDALAFVRAHVPEDAVVAAPADVGYLVGGAGRRTVVGHRMLTVDFDAKEAAVEAFLDAPGPPPFDARFVVVGALSGERRTTWLDGAPGWRRVFAQGDVAIFERDP